jgi:hypothetical protein
MQRGIVQLMAHSKVEEVSDERKLGDGIFCYLVKGWCRDDGAHCVHENTIAECKAALRDVVPCQCDRCK